VKKHFKPGEPVVRSRAAVIYSTLNLRFLSKEQCDAFTVALIKIQDYPNFSVSTETGDSIEPTVYTVTLHDIPWANSLVEIAKLADRFDYNA